MEFFITQYFLKMTDWINTILIHLAVFIINFLNNYVISFFDIKAISLFLNFGTWINILVFAVYLIVVIVDIAEEKMSDKPVNYGVVFSNAIKAFSFALLARWIGEWSMELSNTITTLFGIELQADSIALSIQNILKKEAFILSESIIQTITPVIDFRISDLLNIIFWLILLIALIYFTVVSLKRFGEMFVHILTSALYIPDILRGDTTKMGDWLRQMTSIVLTYMIIYILFFLGCGFFNADNVIFSIVCWISMPSVSKILNKFGWSSGTQGNFGAIALQTGAMMIR